MNEPNKDYISSLTYFTIERSIEWFQQKQKQTECTIYLHSEWVTTSNHSFTLQAVLDMSYKPFSDGSGLFYLHTNQGVFTYGVNTDPHHFINAYRRLKGDSFFC
ncbi:hypothetical protein QWT69_05090 [Sporosarcina oncorhynchi]|uniref:Uncharacterized protein n=1 Tax=Sporosarcina oncorhynchi TaxID=3056444 RepID=A0ABZ0L7F1_9BACL|nr:hypothetical protein [Sporosarcina sp. T2O-4]WOV88494.1 hypothetical protein QWT69_05090 [Sporosarcina sp. T2O-4]